MLGEEDLYYVLNNLTAVALRCIAANEIFMGENVLVFFPP